MTYEFTLDAPKKPTPAIYSKKATAKFQELLEYSSEDETKFQDFFEQNPHFVPGSRDEFSGIGGSGHHPHLLCLISQPKISGLISR